MSQAHYQEHFAVSEVAAKGHELIITWHIIWSSTAHTSEQLDPQSCQQIQLPQSAIPGLCQVSH